MAMHNIREYEKKYARCCVLRSACVTHFIRCIKKKITCYSFRICILYCTCMYIYRTAGCQKKNPQHLFENQSPVEVSLPVYFSLAQNLIKLTLLLILVCLVM